MILDASLPNTQHYKVQFKGWPEDDYLSSISCQQVKCHTCGLWLYKIWPKLFLNVVQVLLIILVINKKLKCQCSLKNLQCSLIKPQYFRFQIEHNDNLCS